MIDVGFVMRRRWLTAMVVALLAIGYGAATHAEPHAAADHAAVGVASWYGARHQGRPTATGVPFEMAGLTAAHRTLALGSRVRVTNLANGRSVEVVINDRGPAIAARLIDLSAGAATVLGMRAQGLARVAVMPLAE